MKLAKAIAAISLPLVLVIALVSCSGKAQKTAAPQTSTVQRGNLVVSTTSTGNLAFTKSEDLPFDMAGTVQSIAVSLGDSVKKGEVLASLDPTPWNNQIQTLQTAVTTAQRNLTAAERQIGAQQLAVSQAQLNLQTAEDAAANIPAVQNAQDLVDNAQAALQNAQVQYMVDPSTYGPVLATIRIQLSQAQKNLQSVLNGTSFTVSTDVALQILKTQLAVLQAQRAVDDANIAVTNATQARDDAKQVLANAQTNLSNELALSPLVTAPFDGFVTNIPVVGGQQVYNGAIAVTVADPTQFQVAVPVGERDVSSLAVGGAATISVNSIAGVTLPGSITAIAPTATISQGVVNYQVTVQVVSSGNFTRGTQSGATTGNGSGTTRTPSASGSSSATTGGNSTRSGLGLGGGASAALAQTPTLRQGLSVTVNLVTAARTNVLLVPNRAISRQQGKSYVTVRSSTGDSQVAVTTGLSNTQSTEITSGLNEGDTIVIATASVSPTTTPRAGGGGIRIPGLGG